MTIDGPLTEYRDAGPVIRLDHVIRLAKSSGVKLYVWRDPSGELATCTSIRSLPRMTVILASYCVVHPDGGLVNLGGFR